MNTFPTSRQRGFTIVEAMVSLAIAAVLLGLALPAYNDFTAQRTLTAQVNDFMVAIQYARSEAANRGTTVSVQAVDAADNANEWGAGWCVVVGAPGNCNGALRVFPPLGDNTLDATGALDTLATLRFNPRGLLIGAGAGDVDLCDPDVERGRQVSISFIGRVSSQQLDCIP